MTRTRSQRSKDAHYLKHYWAYLKSYKLLLITALVLVPVISLLHLVQPLLLKIGIDQHILTGDKVGLVKITLLFGVAVSGEFVFRALQSYVFQYIGQQTVTTMRKDLFAHILGLSSTYFDRTPVGEPVTRLTSDMESLNESFSSGMVTLLSDLLTVAGILAVMLYLNWALALVVMLFVPLMWIALNFFRKRLRAYFNQMRGILSQINSSLQEQLQGIKVVQLFKREERNYQKFEQLNQQYKSTVIASVSYDALLYSFVEALASIVIATLFWFALKPLWGSAVSLGVLVAFIDYTHKLFAPLKDLSSKFTVLQQALAALEKICTAFEIKEKIPNGTIVQEKIEGLIEFDKVSFAYPGHKDKPVLKEISFALKPGQVVALVGPTGSGKTTISRLVARLYEGYQGSIRMDGVELNQWDIHCLREHMSVVLQDNFLLTQTIAFNISLGNPNISQEQIEQAAKMAHIHDFIISLPHQYQTRISAKGHPLSHGQAQLISLARALATPAPIVLLDEATSAVDSISEQKIQKGIESLLNCKTALVIAHRLSTIQQADLILALRNGEIVEQGTHKQLLAQNGFYAKLYQLQFIDL